MASSSESQHSPSTFGYTSSKDSWARTEAKVVCLRHRWSVYNFSFYCMGKPGEVLKSPTFSAVVDNEMKCEWSLDLYPMGETDHDKDFVGIFLRLVSSRSDAVRTKYRLAIMNYKGEEGKALETTYKFVTGWSWGWPRFICRDFLLNSANGLLRDDRLVVTCEVSMVVDDLNVSGQAKASHVTVMQSRIGDDLGKLLEDKKFADIVLSVKGQDFQAHKIILAARSPVFAAMFDHNLKEANSNRVEISDVDPEVARAMLHFIYTDTVTNLDEMACSLLACANKYVLDRLKSICEEKLSSQLSVETAAETLILADMHNASQLKRQVVEFINTNAAAVKETAGWKTNIVCHPELLAEVFDALVTRWIGNRSPSDDRSNAEVSDD